MCVSDRARLWLGVSLGRAKVFRRDFEGCHRPMELDIEMIVELERS